jgi:hypothetical protein
MGEEWRMMSPANWRVMVTGSGDGDGEGSGVGSGTGEDGGAGEDCGDGTVGGAGGSKLGGEDAAHPCRRHSRTSASVFITANGPIK